MSQKFWQSRTLNQMTQEQWESLCDHCGYCCLLKLEDEDSGEIVRTSVSCRLFDTQTCLCQDYANRLTVVPMCVRLTPLNLPEILKKQNWLPDSCAYRRVYEGRPLPDWHPLISGDVQSVFERGVSVKAFAVSEEFIHPDQLPDFIIENKN